jgi:hypothetical protein
VVPEKGKKPKIDLPATCMVLAWSSCMFNHTFMFSLEDLEQMLQRAGEAESIEMPADQFCDLVRQAMAALPPQVVN